MTAFQALPHDVHSLIWSHLDLEDVVHLRQTCSVLAGAISGDKQLWTYIFNRYVKANDLCSPHNLRSIECVGARDVESWVKHAILLDKAYREANRELSIRRFGNPTGLWVTWIKLLLGRWCLIASSDDSQSEFSVWEISSDGEPKFTAKVYLDAPVLDGEVDEDNGYCRCAITVGTSTPYILVLEICRAQGRVTIQQLAEIPDASHVVFFRGTLVGFAALNGSDKYTHIVDWRTGSISTLRVPCGVLPQSTIAAPYESCVTMTIKDGFIFTLHRSAVHVFILPGMSDSDSQMDANYVTKLPLVDEAFDGRFIICDHEKETGSDRSVILHLHFQDCDSELREALIFRDVLPDSTPAYSLSEMLSENHPDVPWPQALYRHSFGTTARRIFCMTSRRNEAWIPPCLSTADIRYPSNPCEGGLHAEFGEYVPILRRGLPLLFEISCLDFDDERGFIVFGTVSGDVRFASFLDTEVISRQSLRDGLIENSGNGGMALTSIFSQTPISLDVPVFYSIRKKVKLRDVLPREVLGQAVCSWYEQANGLQPFANWTNNWAQFRAVWEWITPLSRWGSVDIDFLDRTTSTVVRNRLRALSDITPVVYDADDHYRVIFRIGEQMFYCRSVDHDRDERLSDDFEDDYVILGILPTLYSQFLSDPYSIVAHASDFATQRNLQDWVSPQSVYMQGCVASIMTTFHEKKGIAAREHLDFGTMEEWTDEEWTENYRRALDLEYLY